MTVIDVTIPMKPVPKERPRTGSGHVYTPRKTKIAETAISYAVNAEMKKRRIPPFRNEALRVTVLFSFSTADKKRINTPKKTRPDIDNLGKTVLDALNGVAFKDDGQVADFICRKEFSANDSITISIEPIQAA